MLAILLYLSACTYWYTAMCFCSLIKHQISSGFAQSFDRSSMCLRKVCPQCNTTVHAKRLVVDAVIKTQKSLSVRKKHY